MISHKLIPIFSIFLSLVITNQANSQPAKGDVIFQAPDADSGQTCPKPALERLIRHKIAPRETLETIARRYDLIPATLMGLNPVLRNGEAPVGTEIYIPPYNGVAVQLPAGQNIRDIAKTYNIRPDVLFEINGCQNNPKLVFVPGVNWSPNTPEAANNREISGYPLPSNSPLGFNYGWQLHPIIGEVSFHSGIDLLAKPGTSVLSAGDGTVAFAGNRGNYGNLVVINHQGGKQTRYAHLNSITVQTGQTIRQGAKIGTVGSTGKPDIKQSHLHFEVRYYSNIGWVAEDPQVYLPAGKTAQNIFRRR